MRYLVMVATLLVTTAGLLVCATEANDSGKGAKKKTKVTTPIKPHKQQTYNKVVPNKRATKPVPATDAYRKRMVQGIMALRGHFRHVNRAFAERLVNEAIEVTSMPGNRWMRPHDLIGLAINESDLRWWIETGPYSTADCGITQNHTPLFRNTWRGRRLLCSQLKKSTKLSFIYALKELNMIRRKYCSRFNPKPTQRPNESGERFDRRVKKWELRQYRCLYNNYNQGPVFLWKTCRQRFPRKNYSSDRQHWLRIVRCEWRGLYWLRSRCFATGVRLGKKPTKSCRRALSDKWIKRVYNIR